MHILV
jgi:hypothetical protein